MGPVESRQRRSADEITSKPLKPSTARTTIFKTWGFENDTSA